MGCSTEEPLEKALPDRLGRAFDMFTNESPAFCSREHEDSARIILRTLSLDDLSRLFRP